MKKYKNVILFIQAFCLLLLLISSYLENGLVQLAYCFTIFSVPFLIIAFAEDVLFGERVNSLAAVSLTAELLITVIFVGASVKGMQMGGEATKGFAILLLFFVLAGVFAVVERFALQRE